MHDLFDLHTKTVGGGLGGAQSEFSNNDLHTLSPSCLLLRMQSWRSLSSCFCIKHKHFIMSVSLLWTYTASFMDQKLMDVAAYALDKSCMCTHKTSALFYGSWPSLSNPCTYIIVVIIA